MPPYIKMGRGGAGNIISPEELQQKPITTLQAADVEAQKSTALAVEVAQEQAAQQGDGSEYKHMGRGGAGNWYTPATLATGGTFTDTTTSAPDNSSSETASVTTTATNPDPTSISYAHQKVDPRPWRGRGGAGNYTYDKPLEPERIELQERQIAKELEEEVRRDVEEGLKRPDSAYLGKSRTSYGRE